MATKPISRQLAWQRNNIRLGLCPVCGRKAVGKQCRRCLAKDRKRNLLAYRRRKGLDLDAPVKRRRPRIV